MATQRKKAETASTTLATGTKVSGPKDAVDRLKKWAQSEVAKAEQRTTKK